MPTYQVGTPRVLWTYVNVEAEDENEAIDKSVDVEPGDICHHCSGGPLVRQPWSREMSDEPLELVAGEVVSHDLQTYVELVEG